jgi:Leucine-rich repeat (LRR) protein
MEQLLIGLRAVPKDIPQLDILGTQMEVLPSECARFTQLQKLFLYNTGLSTLQQAMSLSAVKVLSISNTSLELAQVLNLPSLKTLYCKNVSVSEEHQGQFEANGVELRF